MKSWLIYDKRGGTEEGGEDLLFPVFIFVILNVIFFSILLIFIFKASTGALVYEESSAKEIALLLDRAKPGTLIKINFTKQLEVAEKNSWDVSNIVTIKDNFVTVKLSSGGGYKFSYFTDLEFEYEIRDGFFVLNITGPISKDSLNPENMPLIYSGFGGKGVIENPVVVSSETSNRVFKTRTEQELEDAIQKAQVTGDFSSNCVSYTSGVHKAAESYGIDSFLLMALVMKESGCNVGAVSKTGARGLMQITSGTFSDTCEGKIEGVDSISDIEGVSNSDKNLKCGAKILKSKYSSFSGGIYDTSTYQNTLSFKSMIDVCVVSYPRYGGYTGWSAALRGYNTWNCDSSADVNFVESVISLFDKLNECLENEKC